MLSSTEAAFRRLFLEFLAERESRMGSEQGGLHAFYSRRLSLGRLLLDNEEMVARAILTELPRYRTYIEIGAGFGQLGCWLALCGLRIVAIERDGSRLAGLRVLQSLVAQRWPATADRMTALAAEFPGQEAEFDPDGSLIVTTNLVHNPSREQELRVIEGIARHRAAIVDTVRFCRDRTTPEEWAELDRQFAAAGLTRQQIVGGGAAAADEAVERIVWYRASAATATATTA